MGGELTIRRSSETTFAGPVPQDEHGADPCRRQVPIPMDQGPNRTTPGSALAGEPSTDAVAGLMP